MGGSRSDAAAFLADYHGTWDLSCLSEPAKRRSRDCLRDGKGAGSGRRIPYYFATHRLWQAAGLFQAAAYWGRYCGGLSFAAWIDLLKYA